MLIGKRVKPLRKLGHPLLIDTGQAEPQQTSDRFRAYGSEI